MKMSEKATGNSPGAALPVGATAKIPIIPGWGPGPRVGDLTVTLLEVVREKDIAARSQFQGIRIEPPESGFENILLRLRAEYTSSGRGPRLQPYQMTEGQFLVYSAASGSEYPVWAFARQGGEGLIGHTFNPSESREGWLLGQVPQEEPKPLLIFRRENVDNIWGLWSDVWFQLYQP
jgi:hypothetical protein